MAKKLLVTPKGRAIYPHLNRADDKFGAPFFKTRLACNEADSEKLMKQLTDMVEARLEEEEEKNEGKYNEVFLDDLPFYEEDGEVIFSAKLNEIGENKKTGETWKNAVVFYDARGRKIGKAPKIGGGSIIKLSIEPYTWTMVDTEGRGKNKVTNLKVGITLRIKACQLIKLEQFSGASAEDMGFGEEEGYEYDPDQFVAEEEEEEGTPSTLDSQADDDDDDEDF